jgi:hypothetical protein
MVFCALGRMLPKAALLPARENGVDWTAVPYTLDVFAAPNAAKSVTTLRGGDDAVKPLDSDDLESDAREGRGGGYAYALRALSIRTCIYLSVKRVPLI